MIGAYTTQMERVKRTYRSPARDAQAARTRDAIVEAAARLIRSGGLTSATMEAIAAEAGVAVQTVYAAFGSKPGILAALLERLELDADPDRFASDLRSANTAHDQVRAIAAYHRRLFQVGAEVIAASLGSVATDADLDRHVRSGHDRRRAGQAAVVRSWQHAGALRHGLGRGEAADVLWALTAPELYLLHTTISGWSAARYERWLAATIDRLVLR